MVLKPLGIVKEIVEAAGMGISYVFEDIVFLEHNGFLLKFGETDREITIHINEKAVRAELENVIIRMKEEASAREMVCTEGEPYRISQEGDENIQLEFITESNQTPIQ